MEPTKNGGRGDLGVGAGSMPERRQGRVALLPPAVANHIAAGEVVERPASAVKELVENSLDAGATRIDVVVKEGGKSQITVRDNGRGMALADTRLGIQRHATSKVRELADLASIASLGFRGEALSSIAAVAKLTITTRPADEAAGFRLEVAGGQLVAEGPTGAPPGTEVTVTDLFYNTPARRKSLAGAATEFARISEVLQPTALGHPRVAFRLAHNGRTIWQTSGSGVLKNVALEVLGPAIARQLIPVAVGGEDWQGEGLIGLPSVARASRQFQFLIVNGRPVRDRAVREAIEEAYRHLLPLHRWPVFLLLLTVPYDEVDVNVHPTKSEVRFYQEEEIIPALTAGAKAALRQANLIPEPSLKPRASWAAAQEPAAGPGTVKEGPPASRYKESFAPEDDRWHERVRREEAPPMPAPPRQTMVNLRAAGAGTRAAPQMGGPAPVEAPPTDEGPVVDGEPGTFAALLPRLQVLGVVERTYIVAAGPDGLYLIDQHAAHERVMFERFLQPSAGPDPLAQQLAVPEPVELSPTEMALWHEHREQIEAFGFRVESFGPSTLLLREVPWLFRQEGGGHHLQQLLAALAAGKKAGDPTALEADLALRALAACKSAVKARDNLSPSEIKELLAAMARLDNPYTCPHGRPTMINITVGQLERMFGRT